MHKHEKQGRRASAGLGGSVSPRSSAAVQLPVPTKSRTMPRSTSSQLTCLSLSVARMWGPDTFPTCSHQEIFILNPDTNTPRLAAILGVCIPLRITPDTGHSVRRARDDILPLPKGVHHTEHSSRQKDYFVFFLVSFRLRAREAGGFSFPFSSRLELSTIILHPSLTTDRLMH